MATIHRSRQWYLVRQILRLLPACPSSWPPIATWTIPGPTRGSAARTRRLLNSAGCPGSTGLAVTTGARRASPREHDRQAARSKRDRPERAREPHNGPSHVRAAAGGALDPIEDNSATRTCDRAWQFNNAP